MLKQYFIWLLLAAFVSCTSAENESTKNEKEQTETVNADKTETGLSNEKAKELIMEEMDTPDGNVGGTFTDVKEINIQSIEEKDNIYTVKFTWSGTISDPSIPPEPGEKYDPKDHKITNKKKELKLRKRGGKWQVIN